MKQGFKKQLSALLALLMCLMPVFSFAEEAEREIVPGTMYNVLASEAIAAGREVYGDFGLRFDILDDKSMNDEEREVFKAIMDLFSAGSVTFSLAVTPEGGFGKLGIAMQGQSVADVSLNLLEDRALVATSLAPTKAFEVRYDDVAELLGLKNIDWEKVGEMLEAETARYGAVVMSWLAGVPAPAEEGAQPATATRGAAAVANTITITEEKLCELVVAVLEEARGDAILESFAKLPEDETWSDAIDEMIAEVKDELDGNGALKVEVMLGEKGELVALYIFDGEDQVILESKTDAEVVQVRFALVDDEKSLLDMTMAVSAELGETYKDDVALTMTSNDGGDSVNMSLKMQSEAKIEGDVETVTYTGKILETLTSIYEREDAEPRVSKTETTADITGNRVTERKGEDFTSAAEMNIAMDLVSNHTGMSMGFTEFFNVASRTYEPQDLSGLEIVDLLSLDEESGMAALVEVESGLMLAFAKALSLLPQDALTTVMRLTQDM